MMCCYRGSCRGGLLGAGLVLHVGHHHVPVQVNQDCCGSPQLRGTQSTTSFAYEQPAPHRCQPSCAIRYHHDLYRPWTGLWLPEASSGLPDTKSHQPGGVCEGMGYELRALIDHVVVEVSCVTVLLLWLKHAASIAIIRFISGSTVNHQYTSTGGPGGSHVIQTFLIACCLHH
jgi:hypothetical protein